MPDKKSQQKSPQKISDPASALLKIVHGDTKDLHIPHKSIVTGKKIKNNTLRQFVKTYRDGKIGNDEQLVDTIIAFDEAVEKEHLTEDILDEIRKDPSVLDNLES